MLSRVADSLYWMSRYIERAENTARLLDVNLHLSLDLPQLQEERASQHWNAVVAATGAWDLFAVKYDQADLTSVSHFLTFNQENPNSILNSLRNARENARSVQEQISEEMWEQLNLLYLFVRENNHDRVIQDGPHRFYLAIKEGSHTFQGITDATMTHDEGWEFIRAGRFLERADKTTRILGTMHFLDSQPTGLTDTAEWAAVLKSCSAFEAYCRTYTAMIQPHQIAEFLLLHESFPRSVRFCVSQVAEALSHITPAPKFQHANPAQKLTGKLQAELDFGHIQNIFEQGLGAYLLMLQQQLNKVGDQIFSSYMGWAPDLELHCLFPQQ